MGTAASASVPAAEEDADGTGAERGSSDAVPEADTVPQAAVETAVATLSPSDLTVNRIAMINTEGQIETVAPDGTERRVLTGGEQFFQFPAWSPDGTRIAALGGSLGVGGLYVLEDAEADDDIEPIYSSRRRSPFYLYWSPDSTRISFLANDPEAGIGLHLIPAEGGEDSRVIATGSPFYWNWTAAADGMLIHSGASSDDERLALIDDDGQDAEPRIEAPGRFQTPGISPTGRYWAYSQLKSGGNSWMIVSNRETGEEFEERHAGPAALSWSPTRDQLAFTSGEADSRGFWGPLRLMDAATGETRLLTADTVLGFFWSPDGSKIAYISIALNDLGGMDARAPLETKPRHLARMAQQNPHQFTLSVVDVDTGAGLRLADFTPTPLFLAQFLPYFDQYALSHRVWSPLSDAVLLPIMDGREPKIMVVPSSGGQMREIGEGSIAFWSHQ